MDIEFEADRSPSGSERLRNFVGERGGASVFSVFQPRLSRGRRWSTTDDMMADRHDHGRFWSTIGIRQPQSMAPDPRGLMNANQATNPLQYIDPTFLTPGDGMQHQSIRLSCRLPRRVWIVLAKCLGIKLSETDRPILATALHVLTLTAALTFAIPGGWYTVFDIQSQFSKTTVLIGSVQIIIGLAWACLGVYAHNLAGRLFQNRNFVECVRVHSKTFMKISTTWLTVFLGTGILVVNCYTASHIFYDDSCGTAQVEILVCRVFFVGRVTYGLLTLIWNFIVIYVLFSVCRTHTVGIRQLMRELNTDAQRFEELCLKQFHIERAGVSETLNNLEESWYLWDDSGHLGREEDTNPHGVFLRSINASSYSNLRTFSTHRHHRPSYHTNTSLEDGEEAGRRGASISSEREGEGAGEDGDASAKPRASVGEEGFDSDDREFLQSDEPMDGISSSPLLTNEDLLFTYWKFIRRLTVTSRYLQRWLASWVAFVFIWDGYFIIYWTSHSATISDILEFTVPLLILLLVCSAYAEVNAEGQRLLKMICPFEERLPVVYYFNQYPLTVGVFSIAVTYNTMVTAILAFSVAFASRMILDEIHG